MLAAATLILAVPGTCVGLDLLPPIPRTQLSFVTKLRPAITAGVETKIPLGATASAPPAEGGPVRRHVRDWELALAGGGGVTFARPRGNAITPTAFAEAGLMRRLPGGMEARAGLVAVGWLRPEAIGPAVRFEAADAFGAQLGWLLVRDRADGVVLSLDCSIALIRDLLTR